ncbi:MAG: ABC transporter permease, partial [Acidobacteriota bacterium]
MLKAMLWKEWRQQRPVIFLGLVLSVLVSVAAVLTGEFKPSTLAGKLAMSYAVVVWPLVVLLAGAATLAGEKATGTLSFLYTLPISRLRVWTAKVAAGLTAILMVVLVSLALARLLLALAGPGGAPEFSVQGLVDPFRMLPAAPWIAAYLSVLFATAVFFSTFLAREILGAGAALATSMVVLVVAVRLEAWVLSLEMGESRLILFELFLLSILFLLLSLFFFARSEMVYGRGGRVKLLLAGCGLLISLLLVGLPVASISSAVSLRPATAR